MRVPVRGSEKLPGSERSSRGGLELMQAHLGRIHLPERRDALIVCIQYLQRSLFAQMARALRPQGVLLMETFTRAQLEFPSGPRNPTYLLESGELRDAFPGLSVLFYRELRAGQGIPSLVARKRVKHGCRHICIKTCTCWSA